MMMKENCLSATSFDKSPSLYALCFFSSVKWRIEFFYAILWL